MNYELLKIINSFSSDGSTFLDKLMIFITNGALFIFAIILFCLWIFGNSTVKKSALYAGISGVLAILINMGIAQIYFEERPFVTHSDINVLVEHDADASFPSDHTAGAMGIAFGLFLRHKKLGLPVVIFGILTGFSRIYVGNHYPGDVLGGIIIGLISAFAIKRFNFLLKPVLNKIISIWYKISFFR